MASDDTRITLTRTAAASPQAAEVVIPRALGTVQLVREIGRGGMGVVYLGRDTMLGRDVAVKFLLNAVTGPDDPGFARFLEGARAAADVRHGGLNTIFQADVVEGIPYLVLDYIDGLTLSAVVRNEGALSVPACAAILETTASAVGALHDRGILHRDIKPENILLSFEGQAVVTDFGLAHARGASHGNRMGGTPAYMAPEMFDGVVSERSDVYALGITMFEMLTGQLPFRGTLEEVRSKHAADPLPDALLDEREIDRAIRDILERATHKNPMYRHKTAEHFLRALRDAVDRERVATASDLSVLAGRRLGKSPVGDDTPSPASGSSSYHEQIATLAASKRGMCGPEPRESISEQCADTSQPSTLTVDITCIECGYNLRGMSSLTKCPECGTFVCESLKPDRLLFSDKQWFARVVRGVGIVSTATTAFVVVTLLAASIGVFRAWGVAANATRTLPVNPMILLRYGLFALLGVAGIGMYLATTAEPAGDPKRLTKIIRVAIRAFLLLAAGAMGIAILQPRRAATVGVIAELAACLLLVEYVATLVRRVPDRRLVPASRNWLVLIGLLFVASGLLAAMWILPSLRRTLSADDSWWRFSSAASFALVFVMGVATPWKLARYSRALKGVSRSSTPHAAIFQPTDGQSIPAGATRSEMRTEQDADDILRLAHCPQCNYNLDRLPRKHRCPECGFAYDASMFVVYGWASQHHLPNFRRMFLGSRRVWIQLLGGAFYCYITFRVIRSGNWSTLVAFALIGLSVYAQYAFRRSKQRAFGGALQLAFSSEGASIRLGPGEPRFIPWKKFRRLKLRRVEKNRWRLLLSAQRINLFLPSRGGRRSPFGKAIVTAVLECDDAQAECLRCEIQRRLDAAEKATLV